MLFIGLVLLFAVCIAVKIGDKYIRQRGYAKAIVNTSAIAGALFTIVGLVLMLLG